MRRFKLTPRERHIPEGSTAIRSKTCSAVVYVYDSGSKPAAIGYHGKANKHDFWLRFSTPAQREAYVRRYFADWTARAEAMAKRRNGDRRPHKLEVGHILVASWGYEQTNIDYFQVTRVISAGMVELREIEAMVTQETGWLQGKSVPALDRFKGEPMRRRVTGGDHVRIDESRRASLWDGRPESWTSYH